LGFAELDGKVNDVIKLQVNIVQMV